MEVVEVSFYSDRFEGGSLWGGILLDKETMYFLVNVFKV